MLIKNQVLFHHCLLKVTLIKLDRHLIFIFLVFWLLIIISWWFFLLTDYQPVKTAAARKQLWRNYSKITPSVVSVSSFFGDQLSLCIITLLYLY